MRIFFNILILLLIFNSSFAQAPSPDDIVAPAGDYSEGTTLSFSWTLGESVIGLTDITKPYIFTQGFRQAYLDEFIISPPKNLVITPGDQQITLAWSPNTESGIHKYNIYRDISSPATFLYDSVVGSPPDTLYVDTDLILDVTYYYRITAVDEAGNESNFSDEVNVTLSSSRYTDSLALVALYNSTNGPNWTNRGNWLTGELSTWYGISTTEAGVDYISLSQNNLVGTIPSEIGNLTNLIDLELYDNQLTGSIPSTIGNLVNLQNLDLNGNLLTGSIPAEIGNLINLQYLYLANNQFSGFIPAEIGNLASLGTLELYNNQLSGSIPPAIGNLTNLQWLYLSDNQLTGSIPAEIGNLTNLQSLILSYNQLSNTIPDEIGNLVNLELIDMEENQLSGTVPQTITNLINLQYLYLQYNQLTGLPDLSSLTYLLELEIYENKFTFEDIEPNIGVPAVDFYYSPQDSVGIEKTIKVAIDSSCTMSVEVGGDNNLYQWYLNEELIPGATDSSYTISAVTQADYGEYICEITNTLATDLCLYSKPIHLVTKGALSGVYEIGPSSPDFLNFTEAVDSLVSAGIAGAVIFNVESGTYNEQITIPEILGVSSANTVTLRSASGDSTDVILTWASGQAENNFVVKLDGADHFIFRNMTLQATGTDYGRVFDITDDADNNRFLNNQFIGILTYIQHTEEYSAIIFSRAYCDNNIFMYNKFQEGTFGISKCGWDTPEELEAGTQILNNEFTDQIFSSIQLAHQGAPLISDNIISSDYSDFQAINCQNCDNSIIIQKNKISIGGGGSTGGVQLAESNGSADNKGLIVNNFIYINTENSNTGGIVIVGGCTYQEFYYNSVNITGPGSSTSAFQLANGSDIVAKNNIFCNQAGGWAIVEDTGGNLESDFNNLYTTGTNLGNWSSTAISDLVAWQAATGQDANSISVDPEFLSDSDLHTINKTLKAGTPILEITDDIDGETRDVVKPFIGADEYVFIPNTENDILTYSFSEQTVRAIINTVNHTVNIEVAYGTDVTNLVATFTVSEWATVRIGSTDQESGVTANDFTTPVTYTVTAEDGIQQDWIINVLRERIIISFPYSEDFESGKGGWIGTGTNNSWQLGIPSGPTIYFAASGNNAWVTNLTGNYNPNEISYVKGPLFDLSDVPCPVFEFKIWWDIEGFYDGANLQYKQGTDEWKTLGTYQGDVTWYNSSYLYSLQEGFGFNIDDAGGWTGDGEWGYGSNGWITASHALTGLANQSEVRLRVAFASNSEYENDGFAFDDVTIYNDCSIYSGIDDPVKELLSRIKIYPNPNRGKFALTGQFQEEKSLILQVYNLHGQVVFEKQTPLLGSFCEELDLSFLSEGIYYVRLRTGDETGYKKLLIQ